MVTGAGSGIGEAAACGLARAGARVAFVDLDEAAPGAAAARSRAVGARTLALAADVSWASEVAAVVRRTESELGPVDVLVNCAGGFPARRQLVDIPEDEWNRIVAVNLTGVFLCCRAVLPGMIGRGHGRIVNVSSDSGRSPIHLTAAHYSAAKAGVLGLTRHLAKEVGPHGVTVNAVAPGVTLSPRIRRLYGDPEVRRRLLEEIPLGRFAEPEDQADAILFLASDAAGYITGQTLSVNGGKLAL